MALTNIFITRTVKKFTHLILKSFFDSFRKKILSNETENMIYLCSSATMFFAMMYFSQFIPTENWVDDVSFNYSNIKCLLECKNDLGVIK